MKKTTLLILGFLFLVAGIILLLIIPYNIFKSKFLALIIIAFGTFLILTEIITYHRSLSK